MPKGIYKIFRTPQEFSANNCYQFNRGVQIGIQLGLDMVFAALGRKGNAFREKWFGDFLIILHQVMDEYGDTMNDDVVDDPEMWYATARLDAELKKYTGCHHVPWAERYSLMGKIKTKK